MRQTARNFRTLATIRHRGCWARDAAIPRAPQIHPQNDPHVPAAIVEWVSSIISVIKENINAPIHSLSITKKRFSKI